MGSALLALVQTSRDERAPAFRPAGWRRRAEGRGLSCQSGSSAPLVSPHTRQASNFLFSSLAEPSPTGANRSGDSNRLQREEPRRRLVASTWAEAVVSFSLSDSEVSARRPRLGRSSRSGRAGQTGARVHGGQQERPQRVRAGAQRNREDGGVPGLHARPPQAGGYRRREHER